MKKASPEYPELARKAGVQGVVILEATTDVYGRVQNVRVLPSVPLLDKAAIEAVKQWIYGPMVINGRPRPVTFTVTIIFQLIPTKKIAGPASGFLRTSSGRHQGYGE